MNIDIFHQKISEKELFNLLDYLNDSFIPNLEEQVDLKKYASKLFKQAYFIFLKDGEKIIGLIAYYINGKNSFLTSFGIHKSYHNKGLGTILYSEYINILKLKNIEKVELEVHADNKKALEFYKKQQFKFSVKDNNIYNAVLSLFIFVK